MALVPKEKRRDTGCLVTVALVGLVGMLASLPW